MFGVSHFKSKTIVIAGAEHPLGAALARRFAGFGSTVVVVGRDEEKLLKLACGFPGLMEPLALRPGRRNVLALLRDAWGDEPVHIYIDVMALCEMRLRETPAQGFAHSAGVATALVRGMRVARGMALMVVPEPEPDAAPEEQARAAGYHALIRRFSQSCLPGRFAGMSVPTAFNAWDAATCLSAGDAALMMCHPVSRGLKQGLVVEWSPGMLPAGGGASQAVHSKG